MFALCKFGKVGILSKHGFDSACVFSENLEKYGY